MKPTENGVRIREDVFDLPEWDPTLLLYAKAVGKMMGRQRDDPKSWAYQAAVHGDPEDDPRWNQCQHNCWFFLPWHRGYLAMFERIVRSEITDEPDAENWALPYWNYSRKEAESRLVRMEFRAAKLPDGQPNPLAMTRRGWSDSEAERGAETGDFGIDAEDADLSCLATEPFDAEIGSGVATFGGARTGFNHDAPAPLGDLEATPHGSIHVAVGGDMGSFETAGLDPLFWLHHCNIDRLWEVWLERDPARFRNPTSDAWKTVQRFSLADSQGGVFDFASGEMVDTTAPALGYRYEHTEDPLPPAMLAAEETHPMTEDDKTAERVGASRQSVPLGSGPTSGHVAIDDRAVRGAALGGEDDRRVYLNLENIKGSDDSVNYRVFVNPENPEAPDEEAYAGLLTSFGLTRASSGAALHGDSGLTHVIDITELVRRLKAQGRWNGRDVTVTFAPKRRTPRADDLKVGQISVYYR